MPNYVYFYVRAVSDDNGNVKNEKFVRGNAELLDVQIPGDLWGTLGRYNLLSRNLRGGLTGCGDIHHPAKVTFKV
ncbi:uncharacterized protein LOC107037283 [Diachasma alloeum]|uniref:uncharacterized protein LOC107037283 n=1 Tax=Diachasma alloeum TaxID=454923 RepID=UPI0007383503|nr:uncharacterized protein LOC107037283 [Diachasma alloeum]